MARRSRISTGSILILISGIGILAGGCSREPAHPALAEFINREYAAHPEMGIQDLYKLLYQGEFGPGHMLDNPSAAREYLHLEAKSRGSNPKLALLESCTPDSSILRVNIPAFLARDLPLDTLFECFRESAERTKGSHENMKATWRKVGELVEEFSIPFPQESYMEYTRFLDEMNYPSVNHSRRYTLAYRPSYRIVRRDIFKRYFPNLIS